MFSIVSNLPFSQSRTSAYYTPVWTMSIPAKTHSCTPNVRLLCCRIECANIGRMKKEAKLNIRTDAETIGRLNRAAIVLDKPASQIVRELIRRELDTLARKYPELRAK